MSTASELTYAVVTPARNEGAHLRRLGEALAGQSVQPERWIVVDNGSDDDTPVVAAELAESVPFAEWVTAELRTDVARGAPVVHAFHAGLDALDVSVDVVVKLDADISFPPDHFERLLAAFVDDKRLGIAAGTCYEQDPDGVWRQRHSTGIGIRGACRAYRFDCLEAVLPLEERMGWDTLDLVKAHVRGWRTTVLPDLPFLHHRPEGAREPTQAGRWAAQGAAAYYMGYRVSYLLLRAAFKSLRNPRALALLTGYGRNWLTRAPRCADPGVVAFVRREQSVRRLPRRLREARRPRAALPDR